MRITRAGGSELTAFLFVSVSKAVISVISIAFVNVKEPNLNPIWFGRRSRAPSKQTTVLIALLRVKEFGTEKMINRQLHCFMITTVAALMFAPATTQASILLDNTNNKTVSLTQQDSISTLFKKGIHFEMANADYQLDSIVFAAKNTFASTFPRTIKWSLFLADADKNPTGSLIDSWEIEANGTASYHTINTGGPELTRNTSYFLYAEATGSVIIYRHPQLAIPGSDVGISDIAYRRSMDSGNSWADTSISRFLIQLNGTFTGGDDGSGGGGGNGGGNGGGGGGGDGDGDGDGGDGNPVPEPMSILIWIAILGFGVILNQRQRLQASWSYWKLQRSLG